MKFFLIAFALIVAVSAEIHQINSDEYKLFRNTWDKIKHSEVEILTAIFSAHPDIQAKFPKFAGKDLDSIKGSADFTIHATRILSFMTEVVIVMEDPVANPAVKTLLNEFAVRHRNRGVTKEQFNKFRETFIDYASKHAPWGDNVAAIWNKVFDNNYSVIFSSLDGNPVA